MQGRTDDGLTANSFFPDVEKAYDKYGQWVMRNVVGK